jgi:hypothetical protein
MQHPRAMDAAFTCDGPTPTAVDAAFFCNGPASADFAATFPGWASFCGDGHQPRSAARSDGDDPICQRFDLLAELLMRMLPRCTTCCANACNVWSRSRAMRLDSHGSPRLYCRHRSCSRVGNRRKAPLTSFRRRLPAYDSAAQGGVYDPSNPRSGRHG